MFFSKTPIVSVALVAYKHEKFIEQCIKSILEQRGDFKLQLMIFDDASPDDTVLAIEKCLSGVCLPKHVEIKKFYSKMNLGFPKAPLYSFAIQQRGNADYICRIEGDDFWCSPDRIQRHICFLKEHPQCQMSFNAMDLYYDESGIRKLHPEHLRCINEKVDYIDAQRMSRGNPIGSVNCCFYRGEVIRNFPEYIKSLCCTDWARHFTISLRGNIGFLHDVMSVYRIHESGIWSGRQGEAKSNPSTDLIKFMKYVEMEYPSVYRMGFENFLQTFYPNRTVNL